MDQHRIDTVTRLFGGDPTRRSLLRGLTAAGLGWGVARRSDGAAAKKKRKRKQQLRRGLCARNGSRCRRPGKNCKKQYCLRAPFTIEAIWTQPANHDSYLFVPPQDATTGPAPFIYFDCHPDTSTCEEEYPFACISSQDEVGPENPPPGPGDEVTTIHRLLPGTYEYWIGLYRTTPAAELTIVLKDSTGRVVRRWASPANPFDHRLGWHVFDVDGRHGRVTSIDEVLEGTAGQVQLPIGAHDPFTSVCPK